MVNGLRSCARERREEAKMDHRDLPALHGLAKEIARELGEPWRYDIKDSRNACGELWHYATLKPSLSDYGVNLHVDWRKPDRLEVRGRIPTKDRAGNLQMTWYEPQDGRRPAITVAIERGPKAAARAILSRLLPIYEPAYAKACGRVAAHNTELNAMQRITTMLTPFGRLSDARRYNGASDGRVHLNNGGTARIIAYAGRVDLDLRVSAETAVEVLALVDQRRAMEPAEHE
jgi:hypothetical protein